jgi:Secretion system C-terminal sorting domain
MKQIGIILCFLVNACLITNSAFAQSKYYNNWVTGGTFNHIINFDSAQARTFILDTNLALGFRGSHSCINDSLGNLLLMCNGAKLYNKYKLLVENGDTLINKNHYDYFGNGNIYQAQGSVLILPFDSGVFGIFTPTVSDSLWSNTSMYDILYMHKVDMKSNYDSGFILNKKIIISEVAKFARVGMTACRHANGKDWWLAKQGAGLGTNDIYTFYVCKDSVSAPNKQSFTEPHYNNFDRSGQMAFNQQGTKIANCQEQPNQLFVADFDRCYGIISNPKVYNIPALLIDSSFSTTQLETLPSGVCFSPNGRFAYVVMRSKIFQLDLQEADSALAWYLVASLDTTASVFINYYTAQLGPDNRIYIGKFGGFNNAWNYIENPDQKGAACGWCQRCLRFPKIGATSPPNCINFNLGAINPPCAPLLNSSVVKGANNFSIYPNPVQEVLHIKSRVHISAIISISNALGKVVYQKKINFSNNSASINIATLAGGVYSINLSINGNSEIIKFVKE